MDVPYYGLTGIFYNKARNSSCGCLRALDADGHASDVARSVGDRARVHFRHAEVAAHDHLGGREGPYSDLPQLAGSLPVILWRGPAHVGDGLRGDRAVLQHRGGGTESKAAVRERHRGPHGGAGAGPRVPAPPPPHAPPVPPAPPHPLLQPRGLPAGLPIPPPPLPASSPHAPFPPPALRTIPALSFLEDSSHRTLSCHFITLPRVNDQIPLWWTPRISILSQPTIPIPSLFQIPISVGVYFKRNLFLLFA
ncbi:unnamed protein product [Nezara viridula]|uniref:Uncharacterized protein n=1 Tax=Nezara viridula TaxID=85310 RepID=A0A9P0GXX9_NEZVI|nr:unnamed protein product [Nezara viridula]